MVFINLNKRKFLWNLSALSIASSALFQPFRSFAQKNTEYQLEPSDEEVAEILRSEGEALTHNPNKTIKTAFWYQRSELNRQKPEWPSDSDAFDYYHLTSIHTENIPFQINADIIQKLAIACNFDLPKDGARLLFGLRGCRLANSAAFADFAETQTLVETRPDHINAKCLLGVLDTKTRKIFLAKGSTVPCIDLVESQINGEIGCNMLPTGLFHYRVGAHKGKKQPGAFRQTEAVFVHRAKKKAIYSLTDAGNEWDDNDGSLQADNIHAAMLTYRKKPPYFSSAGCQVVEGAYLKNNHQPYGPWARFRMAAGLEETIRLLDQSGKTNDDGKAYTYFLVTGKDAAIASIKEEFLPKTIRFGSTGERVTALSQKLGLSSTSGKFDRKLFDALLSWQISRPLPPTGIITEDQLSLIV